MKITVTNDSPDRTLTVARRADGVRINEDPIAPLDTRSFVLLHPNSSVSFQAGPVVEQSSASAAPVPGKSPHQIAAADMAVVNDAAVAIEQAIQQHAKPRSWNETRSLARKLGAPKNVTKDEAEKLIAAHAAAASAPVPAGAPA